jgi:threonine dehydrogenase-like Zn-dependent dehydrogenase
MVGALIDNKANILDRSALAGAEEAVQLRRGCLAALSHSSPKLVDQRRVAFAASIDTATLSERADEAVTRVRELTGGQGVHSVLECVGLNQAVETAIKIARPGGAVGRVGVPQEHTMPGADVSFYGNVIVGGGPAPVRARCTRRQDTARPRL